MPDAIEYFSDNYAEARNRFILACRERELPVETFYDTRTHGPSGETLATDVVRIGAADAAKVVLVTSGTHGVEGFAGSACQLGFVRERIDRLMPNDMAIVLVHALNPYGFAHLRRVNEDNVDINRNFTDHHIMNRSNAPYEEVHGLLVPQDWNGPDHIRADSELAALVQLRGERVVQAAITGGQYGHADGLFYGGHAPTWSNLTWRTIMTAYLHHGRAVALIDVHTGLGPYAHGEAIFRARFLDGGYDRAKQWYGPGLTLSEDGSSSSTVITGNVASSLDAYASHANVTAITLEFGTKSAREVLAALRAENWAALRAPGSDMHTSAKAQIRDAFYPGDKAWKMEVWERGSEVLVQTFNGLAHG